MQLPTTSATGKTMSGFGWKESVSQIISDVRSIALRLNERGDARCRSALGCLVALTLIAPTFAQNGAPAAEAVQQRTLTGKERLGRKWTDEQRIDNCNVPPDKRGTKPRSSVCPHAPSS